MILRAALERALGESVPEAVERSLLLRQSNPWNAGSGHRWVEVASKDSRRGQRSDAVEAGKDEAIAACTRLLASQLSQQFDYVGDQIDVATLAVLRRLERSARVAPADAQNRLLEIDVARTKRE